MAHHRGLFSTKAVKNLFAYNQDLREGDTRGISFPGRVVAGNREDESTHAKFFCNQAKNYYCKPVASIKINIFLFLAW